MNCPYQHGLLEPTTLGEARVDVCNVCGGLYLDRGELNRVAGPTEGDLEFSTVDLDTFQHDGSGRTVRCPRDTDVEMKKVEFVIETNIILDYCDICRGFWVDGKELARINAEVKELNEADREVPDPALVRFSQFIWNLPLPR